MSLKICYFTTIAVDPSEHFDGGSNEHNAMNEFLRENYISDYVVNRFRCGRIHMGFIQRNCEIRGYQLMGSNIKLRNFDHHWEMLQNIFGKRHECINSNVCSSTAE